MRNNQNVLLKRENTITLETRDAAMRPQTFNAADNTVEAIVATGTPVSRRDARGTYQEILDARGADLDALRGAGVLDAHQQGGVASILGTVDDCWLEGDQIAARIRLSTRPDVAALVDDVRNGIIASVSIGYEVGAWKEGTDANGQRTRTAVKWSPREISFVPVAADPQARTRGLDNRSSTNRAIRTLGRSAGVSASIVDDLIDRGATLEESNVRILQELVTRGAVSIRSGGRNHNETSLDNPEVFQRAASEALYTRILPSFQPSPQARQFVGMSTIDLARECLHRAGVVTTGLSAPTLVTRALQSSSDYPLLLANTMNKSLRDAYQVAPGGIRRIARESTANDFRAKSRIQFDSSGFQLEATTETGEFKYGSFVDSAESYSVSTFGKIFTISRQALINDDLNGFGDVTRRMGMQAAEFERQFLVNLLIAQSGLGPNMSDGIKLFDAAHGNIATSEALEITALSVARQLMRAQTGPGGGLISVVPAFIVVPAALESVAEQLTHTITPTLTTSVNPFEFLTPICEPRLTDQKRWYLAADPALLPCLEFAYLAGAPGPQTETKVGFEVDGVAIKVRLDYGAGFIESRGIVTNAGG
jgi:hypothetical protein